MAAPLVDRSTGDIIPASDHNDVKDYIEDAAYRVNTSALAIGGNTLINTTGDIALSQTSTTGSSLSVSRNLTNTSTDAPVAKIVQDHASDDQPALQLQCDGSRGALSFVTVASDPSTPSAGDVWFNSTNDVLRYRKSASTIDIGSGGGTITQEDFDAVVQEVAEHEIEIIELQANATISPFDHNTLISDTFSDATGYNNYVNVANTTLFHVTADKRYVYPSGSTTDGTIFEDLFNRADSGTVGNSWSETEPSGTSLSISGSTLLLSDTSGSNSYTCTHTFTAQTSGTFTSIIKYKQALTTQQSLIFFFGSSSICARIDFNTSGNITYGAGATVIQAYTADTYYFIRHDFDATARTYDILINGILKVSGVSYDAAQDIQQIRFDSGGAGLCTVNVDSVSFGQPTSDTGTAFVELDLPTITGTVTNTQLVSRYSLVNDDTIDYEIEDASANTDSGLSIDTKNALVTLVSNPTILRININRTTADLIGAWVKTFALKLWKA